MANSILAPTHRYAAGGLLALALYQAQIHQTRPLGSPTEDEEGDGERISSGSSSDSVSEDPQLWIHEKSGLLRPVFRILEIDTSAWQGLEETGGSSTAKHHIGAFLRLLAEDDGEPSSKILEKEELVLTEGVDAMAMSMETDSAALEVAEENSRKYEQECAAKLSKQQKQSMSEEAAAPSGTFQDLSSETSNKQEALPNVSGRNFSEEPVEEIVLLSYQRKVAVLYGLLSACLANKTENDQKSRLRKGYDARYRVALRLLATWLDLKWTKMVCSTVGIQDCEGGELCNTGLVNFENKTLTWKSLVLHI